MTQASASDLYMRFLNLAQAVRGFPGMPELDATDEKLLREFAVAWYSGREIGVVDAMELVGDISPRTVHRRLKSLRDRGLIHLNSDHQGAKKFVVPTELTERYFAELGRCLIEAAG